ncbi:MAG: polyamine aminopropyltransferase [Geminicoccaceae bacterium]|nr:polyamine aminopropyltransferase [Geminicoccaceae bacterium]
MDANPYLPLLVATFVIATAGLVYELIAGTVSSYLLGDSVYQFSLVIGLFMSAMGIGAWLSRHVEHIESAFIVTQVALATAGGLSALALFNAFVLIDNYDALLFTLCILIGTLVGLEIPLVLRILERRAELRINISNILTADYIGALAAALLFPLVLVPQLGLIRTALVFGLLNLATALLAARLFHLPRTLWLILPSLAVLCTAFVNSERMVGFIEARLFDSEIIFSEDTPYQRLVVTAERDRVQLFLNGNLQFDTLDEYRYHESLVHPVMSRASRRNNVLILGGGDGMGAREVERWPDVDHITLVDIDPVMTSLFRDNDRLASLNGRSLNDPRVEIVNEDGWKFLESNDQLYDIIILDLPDPHDLQISRLYSRSFYSLLAGHMSHDGLLVTQATSPLFAREAFWCIEETLGATLSPLDKGETFYTLPYHAYVPSFGEWGFVIAGMRIPRNPHAAIPDGLRFFEPSMFEEMQYFPDDMAKVDIEENTIIDHPLPAYYEKGWDHWFR